MPPWASPVRLWMPLWARCTATQGPPTAGDGPAVGGARASWIGIFHGGEVDEGNGPEVLAQGLLKAAGVTGAVGVSGSLLGA